MKFKGNVMAGMRSVVVVVSLVVGSIVVTGCSSDQTVADATSAAAAANSLAAESKTCTVFEKIRVLNDRSKIVAAKYGTDWTVDKTLKERGEEFNESARVFKANSAELLSDIGAAYDELVAEQPQFKKDLSNIKEVTTALYDTMGNLTYDDLDRYEEILEKAISKAKATKARKATLKIDAFSKNSCSIAFANT
jgi:DNA-binding Lrp family transcriptional regulator